MGLKKTFNNLNNQNINVEYWKISNIIHETTNNRVHVELAGYATKADRDANYKELCQTLIIFEGDKNPLTIENMNADGNNPQKLLYNKITATNENNGKCRIRGVKFDLSDAIEE